MADPIRSPDTLRQHRLPPGQTQTFDWPVVHAGEVPPFDPATWSLAVFPVPLVDRVVTFTWAEFLALPRVTVFADFHSSDGWSRLDNCWEGVPTRELLKHVKLSPAATHVMVHAEYGWSTNLSVEDFFGEDCLFALKHDGQPLSPAHGYPLRLVVPRLFSRKSAKWVRGIEFMEADRPGFYETPEHGGLPMRGDPWLGER
jgi:DMSO/TMAO reductase YedYZ molybdopterin-dependent catalytic subunit